MLLCNAGLLHQYSQVTSRGVSLAVSAGEHMHWSIFVMVNQKVALITGGARGLGLELVKEFSAAGYVVLMGCRDVETGKARASFIKGVVHVVRLDLEDADQLSKDIDNILLEFPRVDVLVNNAGILNETDFLSLEFNKFLEIMQVNALSVFQLAQRVGRKMADNGFGRIINISSGWGAFSDGLEGPFSYSVSKATLNAITKSAARYLPDSVKINAMCPGSMSTDMGGAGGERDPSDSAKEVVYLAQAPDDGPSGQFFKSGKVSHW